MDQPTWIGRTLSGRYRIDALLGQGGMSAVYKASDPNLKRIVAVKMIHSHLSSDPMFVLRFESEASAVASLRHPNIVQVYDYNNDNGVYYMVLEFIPGESLQERLKRLTDAGRQSSVEEALKFAGNISDAMGYAHQRGMVHRDIKPANIMLDLHGQAILMDFGIVKILGGDSHTSTGAVVGTARYMSPEIIRGEIADLRSDIYSLGVTLYEMLSGRPPFVADSAMTLLMMHLNDPVPNVQNFRPEVPAEVVRILEKSLAKDREARYQSAAELSADLKRALANIGGQPAPVRTPGMTGSQPIHATVIEPGPVYDSAPPVSSVPAEPRVVDKTPAQPRWIWLAGAALLCILCLVVAVAGNRLIARANRVQANQTQTALAMAAIDISPTVEPTEEQVTAASPTETAALTDTPTEAPTVTQTLPPLYVRINGITVNDAGHYVVEYETFGYTEILPGQHVHFFFNTVPPEQAGSPGNGPWQLYGGPRPFTLYREADRPSNATQMCALVANNNHSVIPDSGNCMNLP